MNLKKWFLLVCLILGLFLRLYQLDLVPSGLNIDEASVGYNAYSVLKTGHDEYNQKYPLWFRALGDYKLPVHVYSIVLSEAIFGKNEFAVRFPSAFSGGLSIILIYFLTKQILEISGLSSKPLFKNTPLISSFFLAVSPYHIHYSRIAFEEAVALFIFLAASSLFCLFLQNKKFIYFYLSIFLFVVNLYTYNAYRVITPLWIGLLIFTFFPQVKTITSPIISLKNIVLGLTVFTLLTPFLFFSASGEGIARISQTSIFTQTTDQKVFGELSYLFIFLKNYLSHFSLGYFIFANHINALNYHFVSNFGIFYHWQLLFLLLGIYLSIKTNGVFKKLFLGILLISIIPAALTNPSPHPSRSFSLVISLTFFISLGISYFLIKILKLKLIPILIVVFILAVYQFFQYFHNYYTHFPKQTVSNWGGVYKDIIKEVEKNKTGAEIVFNNDNFYHGYIYFLFYDDSLPVKIVSSGWRKPIDWQQKRVLYISHAQYPYPGAKLIKNIYWLKTQDLVAQIWEI